MPDTAAATSTVKNQLPPRTATNHRWPRKWATLGGRGATLPPPSSMFDETDKSNGHHHSNGNGTAHRHSTSLFRKSSTISRTTGTPMPPTENSSLKKSRSLINVLRSKLNSPAVLRRFRTKSRESTKPAVTEIIEQDEKKIRKRDPSPMKRFTTRLAQLTRSSTHTSIETEQQHIRNSPSPPLNHDQDQVDHINACYDEIRAKYFDKNNNNTTKQSTIGLLSQHSSAPLPTERLKDMLSTTTASSIDYYDRPNMSNGDVHNRSLSTISMNGSLLSHDLFNSSQPFVSASSPPKISDDPLLQARKQSNIKLNCMLSGYGFTTPFGNQDKNLPQHDLFKFHHYHDVGKRKFEFHFTNNNNRMYSSLRTRPLSRSIDSFRRTTNTVENEVIPSNSTVADEEDPPGNNELVIREDDDQIERKSYSSKVHVTPAIALNVKAFVTSTSPSKIVDERIDEPNGKAKDQCDEEFERNFLRAVDRALGVSTKDSNHLLQPVYDTPMKIEDSEMNLVEITERALSSFKNSNFFTDEEQTNGHADNGKESPNVELFDRTGEIFDNENVNWQSSAVYDGHFENPSIVDFPRKTPEFNFDEPQVSPLNN